MNITTLELWPHQAKLILKEKNIKELKLIKQVIYPWNSNYDQQRQMFSIAIQERPLFLVIATSIDDILITFNIIKRYNLSMRIVGGRHSTLLQNPEVFLITRHFNTIKLKNNKLCVGSGATQGEVNDYLFQHSPHLHFVGGKPNHPTSLALSTGSAASVGIAGISTVGGIGVLRRTFGLTIDSILSFKIVVPPTDTKNARWIEASTSSHSDLYWALRGGLGSNFGVVTEITYQVDKINKVIEYEVSWVWSQAAEVIEIWQNTAPARPNNFSEDLSVFNDHGVLKIHLTGFYVTNKGESYHQAYRAITAQLSNLKGKIDIHKPQAYGEVYNQLVDQRVYYNFYNAQTILTKGHANPPTVIQLVESAKKHDGVAYIGFQLMGGAMTKNKDTAYYPRDAKFFMDLFVFYEDVRDQQFYQQLNNNMFDTLFNQQKGYVYLGFPILNLDNKFYYGKNKPRLEQIKQKYDPFNLLQFPNSL